MFASRTVAVPSNDFLWACYVLQEHEALTLSCDRDGDARKIVGLDSPADGIGYTGIGYNSGCGRLKNSPY